jgi:GNAT superfamily N-acetyltransferase
MEIMAASIDGRTVGVVVVAYRPNISVAADFASIEELYVHPGARGRGIGRALLDAVGERCVDLGVSYVEVQTDDEASGFYAALGYEEEVGVRVMSQSLMICRE